MTTQLTAADFAAFFTEVTGHAPFAWQTRLVSRLLDTGCWPEAIGAPTGSGKSAVIEAHVFAVAAAGTGRTRPPRRLAVVVDRRALVDAHSTRALELAEHLVNARSGSVSARVSAALRKLTQNPSVETPADCPPPLRTVVLRGAAPRDRNWVDDVLSCTIICATPDMFGSRLLFRGYGSSRGARPREAGLLAYDCAVVIDEAHLSRQLEHTARRVPVLEQMAEHSPGLPQMQVVSTSATLADHMTGSIERVTDDDLSDAVLRRRLRTPKPIHLITTPSWPGRRKPKPDYIDLFCDRVLALRNQFPHNSGGRTIGCIVNNVDTAQLIARRLSKQTDLTVICRTGRSRPFDFDRNLDEGGNGAARSFPGLYTIDGNPNVDVLVTTQTIEVGVDIDFSALVTELAPATALAQRFGRVNRIGRSSNTKVEVVVPSNPSGDFARPPYSTTELEDAVSWLKSLANDAEGASPWAVAQTPPPPAALRRTLFQRPEDWNARHWSHTSLPSFADDVSLFLRDDLDPQQADAGIVVRSRLPEDETAALSLLRAVPPQAKEVFPCPVWVAQRISERIVLESASGEARHLARAFRYRDNELDQLNVSSSGEIRAGDVIVLDDEHPILSDGVISAQPDERAAAVPWEELDGVVTVLIGDQVEALGPDWELEAVCSRVEVKYNHLIDESVIDERLEAIYEADGDDQPAWVVVQKRVVAQGDDALRQEVTLGDSAVPLGDHEQAVAERADMLATRLGITSRLRSALSRAAGLHDRGKQAERFQHMLGAKAGQRPIAKSTRRTRVAAIRAKERSGLPTRWRHEQLSAVYADVLTQEDDAADSSLIVQLVGTSHGHGRPNFRHSAATLLAGMEPIPHTAAAPCASSEQSSTAAAKDDTCSLAAAARELFDAGEWDTLIERNRQKYGTWGVAVLEAILRAADAQVSQEGS